MNGYYTVGIPIGSLIIMAVGSIVFIRVGLAKRRTNDENDEKYVDRTNCKIIHKNVDEKLKCLPEINKSLVRIETTVKLLLKQNGGG